MKGDLSVILAVRRVRMALKFVPKLGCLDSWRAGGTWESTGEAEEAGSVLKFDFDIFDEGTLEQ